MAKLPDRPRGDNGERGGPSSADSRPNATIPLPDGRSCGKLRGRTAMAARDDDARFAALRRLRARGAAAVARIGCMASVVASDTRRVLNRPVREVILVVASVAPIVGTFKLFNNQ